MRERHVSGTILHQIIRKQNKLKVFESKKPKGPTQGSQNLSMSPRPEGEEP